MFDGYLGQPEVTAACWTADGWFRTGDVATIGPDGWHRIVGRASVDLIKSGGYRIGAGEVEAALLAHPGVHEAAVIGEPDPDLGQRIVAFVVADEGTDAPTLTRFVADGLSAHKRPRQVVFVSSLPRNALGKVQKSLLTDRAGDEIR
jgi:fatty acid CoA ligase FadD36